MRTLHRGYLHGGNKLWDHIQHRPSEIHCSNQEYALTLIFQGITQRNAITTFMLQEIPVLQKINDHSYLDGACRDCL